MKLVRKQPNRHSGAGRNPKAFDFIMRQPHWIPACAGMTDLWDSSDWIW